MIRYNKPKQEGNNLIFTLKQCRQLELVGVSAGGFYMGSDTDEPGHNYDELEHSVTLSQDFYIGKHPITRQQYAVVMGGRYLDYETKDLPEEGVSWSAAMEYCERLNQLMEHVLPNGYHFDLPTEAQWEFAARGGVLSKGFRFSGSNEIDEVAWYNDNSDFALHAVGLKRPNELGIYDMSGNIREWCRDYYAQYRMAQVVNPAGPQLGLERILRGGGYTDVTGECRSAARSSQDPDDTTKAGFRIALVPTASEETYEVAEPRSEEVTDRPRPEVRKAVARPEDVTWANACLTLGEGQKIELRILQSGQIHVERSASYDGTWRVQHIPVDTAYFIAKFPVTQAVYKRVMGNNPSFFRGEQLPVENVSWFDAIDFCKRLNELAAGKLPKDFEFTLPDQNYWEYAATGGCYTDRMYGCGWYIANSQGTTHEVGKMTGNLLGLYDMRGNVWEWCRNNAFVNEYGDPLKDNERGQISRKAIMGGGWNSAEEVCFFQDLGRKPETKDSEIGFRVILRPREGVRMQFGYPPIEKLGEFFKQKEVGTCESGILVLPNHVPLPMVRLPHGLYTTQNTIKRKNGEHRLTETLPLTFDCWIGQYPVTQQQFEAVMGFNPSFFKGEYRPVESVTLEEALEFCRRLNKISEGKREEGYNYAIPKYITLKLAGCGAAGSVDIMENAWLRENAGGETHDVGKKRPNLIGVFDYLGNVDEWCGNYCRLNEDGSVSENNLVRDKAGNELPKGAITLGCSWQTPKDQCNFDKHGAKVDTRSSAIGFRVVLTYVPNLEPDDE